MAFTPGQLEVLFGPWNQDKCIKYPFFSHGTVLWDIRSGKIGKMLMILYEDIPDSELITNI